MNNVYASDRFVSRLVTRAPCLALGCVLVYSSFVRPSFTVQTLPDGTHIHTQKNAPGFGRKSLFPAHRVTRARDVMHRWIIHRSTMERTYTWTPNRHACTLSECTHNIKAFPPIISIGYLCKKRSQSSAVNCRRHTNVHARMEMGVYMIVLMSHRRHRCNRSPWAHTQRCAPATSACEAHRGSHTHNKPDLAQGQRSVWALVLD